MEKYLEIIEVHGREILDSRGNPTVAAIVTVKDKETGRCTKGYYPTEIKKSFLHDYLSSLFS